MIDMYEKFFSLQPENAEEEEFVKNQIKNRDDF